MAPARAIGVATSARSTEARPVEDLDAATAGWFLCSWWRRNDPTSWPSLHSPPPASSCFLFGSSGSQRSPLFSSPVCLFAFFQEKLLFLGCFGVFFCWLFSVLLWGVFSLLSLCALFLLLLLLPIPFLLLPSSSLFWKEASRRSLNPKGRLLHCK